MKKQHYIKLLLPLLMTCALAYSCSNKTNNVEPIKPLDNKQFDGIDVSHHQGTIDWKTVSKDSRVKFVYIKATEGSSHKDSKYSYNIKNARKHGLKCGSYHYFTMHSKAQAQFNNFKATAKKNNQDLIPMVDVELNGKDKNGWMIDGCHTGKKMPKERDRIILTLGKLLELIEKEYGCKPIIYCSYASYVQVLCDDFKDYPIILGNYAQKPRIDGYLIWQFTEKGRVNGIKGAVDLSRFHKGVGLADIELITP